MFLSLNMARGLPYCIADDANNYLGLLYNSWQWLRAWKVKQWPRMVEAGHESQNIKHMQ